MDIPKKKKRLVIYCGGVHEGGGLSLLNAFINCIPADQDSIILIKESVRVNLNLSDQIYLKSYRNSLISRIYIEYWLFRNVNCDDLVLCFGNLPPLFKLKGKVFTYLQNRYLVDKSAIFYLKKSKRLLLALQKLWLYLLLYRSNYYIVQTETMKRLLLENFAKTPTILVWPFSSFQSNNYNYNLIPRISKACFIYPASGEPHKNHINLIKAWIILGKKSFYPKLVLTVDKNIYPDLLKYINDSKKTFNLNIENIGIVSSEVLQQAYRQSQALIFPSLLESFGLPLLEASFYCLPLLTSEMDYTRDLGLKISESFDPKSPLSISRAIMRFIGQQDEEFKIFSPFNFYLNLMNHLNESNTNF